MEKQLSELLKKTKQAYLDSAIAQSNPEWQYSVCATRIKENKILLVGFNWGAEVDKSGTNVEYKAQTLEDIKESANFKGVYQNLASFKKVYNQLKEYLPHEDIDNCIQSNFCFFRSRNENQISSADLELSKPLFKAFLTIIKPNKIICFSSKLRDYFWGNELLLEKRSVKNNKKIIFVGKGFYQNIPIYFLPHPTARILGTARKEAWDFCFRN